MGSGGNKKLPLHRISPVKIVHYWRRHPLHMPLSLPLPRSLSTADPPALASIDIVLLMSDHPCHQCHVVGIIFGVLVTGAIFLHPFPTPPPIVVFASPSSSASLPPGKQVRGCWRGRPPPSLLGTSQRTIDGHHRCGVLIHVKKGGSDRWPKKQTGLRQKTVENGRTSNKTAQNGTKRHGFLCRHKCWGGAFLPPFSVG